MDSRTRLLFVDDDLPLLRGLETHFRRLGYAPYVASTGSEGLRQMYAVQPDLVALDLSRPAHTLTERGFGYRLAAPSAA